MLNKAILAAAASGTKENYWIAKLATAGNNEYIDGIAVAADGSIYFTGRYTDTTAYALIGKLNANGTLGWQRTLGEIFNGQVGRDIAFDSLGNLYVVITEETSGPVSYVASYTSTGTVRWQRSISNCLLKKIAVDSSGNAYVAGYFNNSGTDAGLLIKYNSSGVLQSQKALTSIYPTRFDGLSLDAGGNPLVCGYYIVSSYKRFLTVKYNSSSVVQLQRAAYTSSKTWYGSAITSDSSSNIYAFGYADGDLFAIKYSSSGSLATYTAIDRAVTDIYDAATDSAGNVYVTSTNNIGTFYGTERRTDIYTVKYDSALSVAWQRYLGTINGEGGYAVATKSFADFYLAGLTYSNVTNAPNGLVAFLPATGSLTGTYGSYYYNSASWSTVSKSFTSITPSLTDSSATLTESASTLSDSAVTLTVTKTDI
jgi:hypothetical protein